MLNSKQIQSLKQRLDELRRELVPTLQAAADAGSTVELDQTRQGRLSRMDALQGQAMAQAAHARATARMHSIDLTLARLHEAGYGECLECGESIPYARLLIDPTLRFCVACAEAAEA